MTWGTMFRAFNPREAIDVRAFFEALPREAQIRGLFFDVIETTYARAGKASPALPALPFQLYDRRRYLELMLQAVEECFPDHSNAAGLFEIGKLVYPEFANTMIGRAIFSVAGRDFLRMVQLASRAYAVANNRGTVKLIEVREGLVHASFDDVWDFPAHSLGIWCGAMQVSGLTPRFIEYRVGSLSYHEIRLSW